MLKNVILIGQRPVYPYISSVMGLPFILSVEPTTWSGVVAPNPSFYLNDNTIVFQLLFFPFSITESLIWAGHRAPQERILHFPVSFAAGLVGHVTKA